MDTEDLSKMNVRSLLIEHDRLFYANPFGNESEEETKIRKKTNGRHCA